MSHFVNDTTSTAVIYLYLSNTHIFTGSSFFPFFGRSLHLMECILAGLQWSANIHQTLTRVSISRNSRREMTQIFLSRLREANFHVSFSSRFSRIGGKVSLSPLDFQDLKKFLFLLLRPISLSPLDFQDFGVTTSGTTTTAGWLLNYQNVRSVLDSIIPECEVIQFGQILFLLKKDFFCEDHLVRFKRYSIIVC